MISERVQELAPRELGKLLTLEEKDHRVISLGPGEPDFGPPAHVIHATERALRKPGMSRYSPVKGRQELIEAICKKVKRENKINAQPDNVIVTSGSNEAILLSLMCIIDPGEVVATADPSFLAYIPTIHLLNGSALSLPVIPEYDWQLIPELVRKQIRDPKRTRAIIINSPANPTGAVYSRKTLEALADIAIEYDLLIISDEAYEKFTYRTKHISIASLNGMQERVLTLQSFSKTYGMPGFRVGYAIGPEKLIKAMRKVHLYASICAPTLSQLAALAALKGPQARIKKIVKEYDKRRRALLKRISQISLFECTCEPQGAFYVFPKLKLKMRSVDFCHWLAKRARVLVVPGTDFGRYGEGYVRLSYATDPQLIERACDRIERAAKLLSRGHKI